MQLPEYLSAIEHQPARRIDNRKAGESAIRTLDSLLRLEFKTSARLVTGSSLNYTAAKEAGLNERDFEDRIRQALVRVDGVTDVYFRRELLDSATPPRPYLEAYRHSMRPERSLDFLIRDCEFCLVTGDSTGTNHGSPYAYDTRVPIVFWGATIPPQHISRIVHTVDISATLAQFLSIQSPRQPRRDSIDGDRTIDFFRTSISRSLKHLTRSGARDMTYRLS